MAKRRGFRDVTVDEQRDPMKGPSPVVNGMGGYRFTLNTMHPGWGAFKVVLRQRCKAERNDPEVGRYAQGFLNTLDGATSGGIFDAPIGAKVLEWIRKTPGWAPAPDGRYPVIALRGKEPSFETEEEVAVEPEQGDETQIVRLGGVNANHLVSYPPGPIKGKFWGLGHVNGKAKYVQVLVGPLVLVCPIEQVTKVNPEKRESDVVYEKDLPTEPSDSSTPS